MDHEKSASYKLAILGSFPPLRGLSSYCLEFTRAILHFCNVKFLSFKKLYPSVLYPGSGLKNDDTFPEISDHRLDINRKLTWYNPIGWFFAGFRTKADILHAQWWSLPLFPVYAVICLGFKLRGIPVVFTVHNVLPHEKSLLYPMINRLLYKLGDHFIVHTSHNAQQMIRYYNISKNRISLIPHGTLDFHVRDHEDRNAIRHEMGFDENHKVILFFGAVRPYKGLDTLIRSFSLVLKAVPETRLLVAGKLWVSRQPYDALIKSLGIADYVTACLDYIPSGEVYKFFTSSDLVVVPYHRFDSQSGVGTTAIAFRKPLIVTNVGGLPSLVSDSRYVVPPNNIEALSKAMVDCLDDPHQMSAMSLSANKIAEDLSWPAIAKKTCDVYDSIIKR